MPLIPIPPMPVKCRCCGLKNIILLYCSGFLAVSQVGRTILLSVLSQIPALPPQRTPTVSGPLPSTPIEAGKPFPPYASPLAPEPRGKPRPLHRSEPVFRPHLRTSPDKTRPITPPVRRNPSLP